MIKSIYSLNEASLDQTTYSENFSATASREASVFDVYSDSNESSHDNPDPIIDALANSNLNPAMITHLQNYSTVFEMSPASTIFCFDMVLPLHPYGKLDPRELN